MMEALAKVLGMELEDVVKYFRQDGTGAFRITQANLEKVLGDQINLLS